MYKRAAKFNWLGKREHFKVQTDPHHLGHPSAPPFLLLTQGVQTLLANWSNGDLAEGDWALLLSWKRAYNVWRKGSRTEAATTATQIADILVSKKVFRRVKHGLLMKR